MFNRVLLGILLTFFAVGLASAQSVSITSGINWLAASQNSDKSWGGTSSSVAQFTATAEVLDALRVNGNAGTSFQDGTNWLKAQSLASTESVTRRLWIVAQSASVVTDDLNRLIGFRNSIDGNWGLDDDYSNELLDTSLALQALKFANYSDLSIINPALAYLTRTQNPDGGWGFCQGGDSNIYMTAVVSAALQQFPQVTSIATAVNKASAYLVNHQNGDGGFGASESTPYETALAYSALAAVSSNSPALTAAINYLTVTQSANGSWQEDPYSTALALKALYYSENKPAPPPAPLAGGTITGTAVDAVTKARVPGVAVSLASNSLISTTSDSSGNFTLSDVPAATQSLSFSASGYAAKTVSTSVTVGGTASLGDVALLSSYSTGYIAGTITDSAGKPLPDVTVSVSGAWSGSAVTGADGSYSFSYVLPGDVTITAAKAGFQPVTGSGTVFARTKLSFSPRLSTTASQGTTGTLVGRVVDDYWGVPIGHLEGENGVQVFVSGRAPVDVEPEGGGYFAIAQLQPGTYQVIVGMNGFKTRTFRVIVLPGVTTDLGTIVLEMTVSEMALTGTITDAASGAPIPGAEVAIAGTDLAGRADFAGTYAIAGIKVAGELTVKISASGYTGRTIVMKPAPWTHTINFSLTQQVTTGGLTGTVIDAITNEPLGGVNLSVADDQAVAATGADGVFNFRSLQPGTHSVTLSLPGYSSRVLTTAITVGAVSDVGMIAISTGSLPATVQGRVWDAPANAPFAGVAVKAAGTNALDTVSAPDGSYRIENIDPGHVTIATGTVPKTGYGSARFSAQLEPGGVLVFNPVLSTSVPATVDLSVRSDKDIYKAGESANVAIHVQNRQSVDTPATLYLQVFDPYGATLYESSSDVLVPADGQSDLPVSVALPAAAVSGTYRMVLSAYAPDGLLLRDAMAGFGVAVSQVAITPMFPPAFSGGANTLSFSLNNQGILPVSAGNLVVTLKEPEGQVVSSTATPFSLDPGGTVNLAPIVTFPALKLGNYTLAYVVNDETRNGVATELQVPSSFSIAGLYDDTSRRVRNTANLTVTLGNTGKINIPAASSGTAATVTVSVPDAGYSETKQLSALPAVGGAMSTSVAFSFVIPETISAGQHATKITLTLPSGSSLSQSAMLTITESSLSLASVQGAYTAGDVIHTAFANSGGVDTQVQYRMSLYDAKSMLLAEKNATEGIVAGSTLPLDIAVPAGAVDGSYNLVIAYADLKTGKETVSQNPITVRGVKGTLQVQTGKENYLLTENVTGTSAISNSGTPLDGGMLHLQVVTGPGSEKKKKTWTTQADFQTGVRNGVDTYGVNDWIIPDDDFSGAAVNGDRWKSYVNNGGVLPANTGEQLQLETSGVTNSASGVTSNFQLDGDFDTQVDYEINSFMNVNSHALFIASFDDGSYFRVGRQGSNYQSYKVWPDDNQTTLSTDTKAKLRLTRTGNVAKTWYWNGSQWINQSTWTVSAAPVRIRLSATSYLGTEQLHVKFDNFKVNSGRIKTENQTVDSVRLLPLNDNFDDNIINEDRWVKLGDIPTETSGSLHLVGTTKWSAVRLNYYIPENFSIVSSFKNFRSGFHYLQTNLFGKDTDTYSFYVGLTSSVINSWIINNHVYYSGPQIPYSATSGSFRLTKAGTNGFEEYWDGSKWATAFSDNRLTTGPAVVYIVGVLNGSSVNVDVDHFYTDKGTYARSGTLSVKHDSGKSDNVWGKLWYTAAQPSGTSIRFRTRTSETESGLASATWSDYLISSGSSVTSPPARWIEVEATLNTSDTNFTPLLNDLTVSYESAPAEVLWQTDVPANLAQGALTNLDSAIGTLPVIGKLYLQGSLLSSTGQTVATAEYPFYVEQGNTQVVLKTDKKIYRPGETVTVTGETRNFSSIAASGLTLRVQGNDGSSLYNETLDIAANSARQFSFTTVAAGDGVYLLAGSLVQNTTTIAETAEQYEVATPALSALFTAPETVGEAPFTVAVTINNTGRISATANVHVVDDAGEVVGEQAVTVAPGESRVVQYSHQVYASTTYSAILTGDLNQVLTKSVSFSAATATVAGSVSSKIVADRISYKPNEQVTLSATISSTSMREGLSAQVAIVSGQGQAVYTATPAIPSLMQGQVFSFKNYWNCGITPSGTYVASVKIIDASGQVISTASSEVVIDSVTNPAALLKGTLSTDKQSVLTSEPVGLSYSVTNSGNVDVGLLSAWIRVIDLDGTVLFSATEETTLAMGATHAWTARIDTAGYGAKDYLVLLGATIGGVEEMLASTYFRVEGAPTVPALFMPAAGSDVETATPTLSVSNAADPNADRLSYEFEVYADRGMTTLVASGTVSETSGTTSWTLPVQLVENRTYFWRARAYDGRLYGLWMDIASFRVNTVNDPPQAPTVSGPVSGSEVAQLKPALAVNNAADPDSAELTYNFAIALDPEFTQVVASVTGIVGGEGTTSWMVPDSLQENTSYYWRAQADDWFIEGPWSTTATFFVNTANDAPTAPVVVAPAGGETVASLATDVVVRNGQDPDSPHLSYYFEADTTPSFDSENLIRSGSIDQGENTTSWAVTGLRDNARYFVRAKASDGTADSPWSPVSEFAVNTLNDAPTTPTLANPSDGSGVTVLNPALSVHNATDLDHDVLSYQFAVYADPAMTQLVAGTESVAETGEITSWEVPQPLTENMTYYWRSRAFDGAVYSDWMPAAAFTVNTANDSPSAPKPFSPAENSSVETATPTLQVINAVDPDSNVLSYDFEIYFGGGLVAAGTQVPGDASGMTSWVPTALADNSVYQWRARAFDGESYGPWTALASFTVHLPTTSINAAIDFDPDTLNRQSNGTWVVVYIELPSGYRASDIDVSSIRLEGSVPAEVRPYSIGDHDKDGSLDLMVKFRRSDVMNLLGAGEKVTVHLTGKVGEVQFEGVDIIRVIK